MRMMVPFCLMLFPLLSSIFVDSIDICLSQKEIGIKLVTLTTVGYLFGAQINLTALTFGNLILYCLYVYLLLKQMKKNADDTGIAPGKN